jgi:hypothetical protein
VFTNDFFQMGEIRTATLLFVLVGCLLPFRGARWSRVYSHQSEAHGAFGGGARVFGQRPQGRSACLPLSPAVARLGRAFSVGGRWGVVDVKRQKSLPTQTQGKHKPGRGRSCDRFCFHSSSSAPRSLQASTFNRSKSSYVLTMPTPNAICASCLRTNLGTAPQTTKLRR